MEPHPADSTLPPQITTPDRVDTRLGSLAFPAGIPTPETVDTVYDYLDLARGVDSFLNGLPGVSVAAIRAGFHAVGVNDNTHVLLFSGLMDSNSLFLTANADTVYFVGFLDLSDGPMVVEAPRDVLAILDDMWFHWITDMGIPGPDRGAGGKYLVLPPGYTGPLPQGGYFLAPSRTNGVCLLGRAFLEHDDPQPAVTRIKDELKLYPYRPGSHGTSIGAFLNGEAPLTALSTPQAPTFVEGTGLVMNTVLPNDFSFYELLDALVQHEPAEALEPEIAGQFAAIGIVKGKTFSPDQRMRAILAEAVAVGNAAGRTIGLRPRAAAGFGYYEDGTSQWGNFLYVGGYEFMTPPPLITPEGVKPFARTGARTLDSRIAMFYVATGITPAMVMRLPNVGSAYLLVMLDATGTPFDGSKTYRVTLPPEIPAAKFWSITLYDNQSRSMLQTAQRFPRAGSQSYPTPAAVAAADGTTTVHFSPTQPATVADGNWIQTAPGKGWFAILRLYSPLASFHEKTWRPGEIEPTDTEA